MRTANAFTFILATFALPCFLKAQQTLTTAPPTPIQPAQSLAVSPPTPSSDTTAPASGAATQPPTVSALLQPTLSSVQGTIAALKLDKWKKGSVRDEAGGNVNAILKDLQTSLPPLVKTADAAPDAVVGLLPVSRNVNALYNVLLRVEEASRVAAPGDQADQLQKALIKLGDARRAIDDRIEDAALAQEKQMADLRSTVKAQAEFKCPAAAPAVPSCPAPTPSSKKKKPASSGTKSTPTKPSTNPPAGAPQTGK